MSGVTSRFTVVKRMSFKRMVRELKKENCELHIATLDKYHLRVDQKSTESASQVNSYSPFKKLFKGYSDVFRQEIPDELPPKQAF